ncbi:hypothetical protein [Microcoleus sp. herbarium14]|uniref:hypothetical protein n=1 Tax=Microcoleus sp. herbarium14 TaxID=3055439 RepID=UPI002FD64AB1
MAQPELNLPIGRSGFFAGDADIYNSNENFSRPRSGAVCLMPERTRPVTTSEVFLLSSSCDKYDKAVISR